MRLLFVVNVDWFFLSHRLPVGLEALAQGHEVHVATTLTTEQSRLEAYGFIVHPMTIERSSIGLWGLLKFFVSTLHLFWHIKPDIVHLITIKPVLIGGLAAKISPIKGVVYAISGLGHVFVAQGLVGRIRRKIVGWLYRHSLGFRNKCVIFQNPDDQFMITAVSGLSADDSRLILGSGVDLTQYQFNLLEGNQTSPIVLMAARLLVTKGVRDFVEAAKILKEQKISCEFWLAGEPDYGNLASITESELTAWRMDGNVKLLGHRSDVQDLMSRAAIVVLPSYREGLPRVLIEAAACGRAVVTTDVPGCRDAIQENVTGFLVPAQSPKDLAHAIEKLILNISLAQEMGRQGRNRAEQIFDIRKVVQQHMQIYQELCSSLS